MNFPVQVHTAKTSLLMQFILFITFLWMQYRYYILKNYITAMLETCEVLSFGDEK